MSERDPQKKGWPFAEEEAVLARQSWLRANMTPKVAILLGKLYSLSSNVLNILLVVALMRLSAEHGKTRVQVVRVNDVGRAEAVRLDTDYIPEEPELRDQLERFVLRYYTRNGFSIPEAIEALPIYMEDESFRVWKDSILKVLEQVARGDNVCRVRILYCSVYKPKLAKTTGTTATIRIAEDPMTPTGGLANGKSQGFEVTIRFKIGVYPQFKNTELEKTQWVTRNPLGMKILDLQRTHYIGADVEDKQTERAVEAAKQKAEEAFKYERNVAQPTTN